MPAAGTIPLLYPGHFNGHTQVNATDLRFIKYPSREALIATGKWAIQSGEPTQALIDEQPESLST